MWYRSAGVGEWPRGIHWTPGERRFVPDDYPREGAPPSWLVESPDEAPEPRAKGG